MVDSHPEAITGLLDGKETVSQSTRYQIADAAFSLDKAPAWEVSSPTRGDYNYPGLKGISVFDDSKTYINNLIPDAGRIVRNMA